MNVVITARGPTNLRMNFKPGLVGPVGPSGPLTKASAAQAQAATDDTVGLTPAGAMLLLAAQGPQILKLMRAVLPVAPDGLASGEPWLDGNTIVFVP